MSLPSCPNLEGRDWLKYLEVSFSLSTIFLLSHFKETLKYHKRSPPRTSIVSQRTISLLTCPSVLNGQISGLLSPIFLRLSFLSLTMWKSIWDLLCHNCRLVYYNRYLISVCSTGFLYLLFFKLEDFYSGYFTQFMFMFSISWWVEKSFAPCFVFKIFLLIFLRDQGIFYQDNCILKLFILSTVCIKAEKQL